MPGLKRHPALQDLSRDHQLILLEARGLRWAAQGDRRGQAAAQAAAAFLRFWRSIGELHLREEEEVLLPLCRPHLSPADEGLVARWLADHAWLREASAALEQSPPADNRLAAALEALSRRLHDHVRWEERTLFARVQEALSAEEMDRLAAQSQAFRLRWRGPSAVGPAGGACAL
ncbi:MAG: hemerythrin domain-containing protein [Caldilineales bacterium]|nr:hemerythrin domain-containing protein [Caldilineales bacterium]MDW8319016.1 hemerythrin domain-containing protein [Anaerolineae bacterium]